MSKKKLTQKEYLEKNYGGVRRYLEKSHINTMDFLFYGFYRDVRDKLERIKCLIKDKIGFSSDCNTLSEAMKLFLSVKCPRCGRVMKRGQGYGGSSGNNYRMTFEFTCSRHKDATLNLTLTGEAFSYYFKKMPWKED